jgi:hypothetical protein
MSTTLDQIAGKAKSAPKLRFTTLAHLLTPAFLKETWPIKKSPCDCVDSGTPLGRNAVVEGRFLRS